MDSTPLIHSAPLSTLDDISEEANFHQHSLSMSSSTSNSHIIESDDSSDDGNQTRVPEGENLPRASHLVLKYDDDADALNMGPDMPQVIQNAVDSSSLSSSLSISVSDVDDIKEDELHQDSLSPFLNARTTTTSQQASDTTTPSLSIPQSRHLTAEVEDTTHPHNSDSSSSTQRSMGQVSFSELLVSVPDASYESPVSNPIASISSPPEAKRADEDVLRSPPPILSFAKRRLSLQNDSLEMEKWLGDDSEGKGRWLLENRGTIPPSPAPTIAKRTTKLEQLRLVSELSKGIDMFNQSPLKGIYYLIEMGCVRLEGGEVAKFLREAEGLQKVAIGKLFGSPDPIAQRILADYTRSIDLADMPFDDALRYFLSSFTLPGEAQMIDRIMESFSTHFYNCNSAWGVSKDSLHILAYSCIMLHTDAHHPMVKHRMSKKDFVRNLECVTKSGEVSVAVVEALFDGISAREMKVENTNKDSKTQALFTVGTVFIKFGRAGKPHRRRVCIVEDGAKLIWMSPSDDGKDAKFIMMNEIQDIVDGSKTPVFRRYLQGGQGGDDTWQFEADGGPESDNELDGLKKRLSFVLGRRRSSKGSRPRSSTLDDTPRSASSQLLSATPEDTSRPKSSLLDALPGRKKSSTIQSSPSHASSAHTYTANSSNNTSPSNSLTSFTHEKPTLQTVLEEPDKTQSAPSSPASSRRSRIGPQLQRTNSSDKIDTPSSVPQVAKPAKPSWRARGGRKRSTSVEQADLPAPSTTRPAAPSVWHDPGSNKFEITSDLCFSIITARRSLDLMAPNKRLRDEWIAQFRHVIERNNIEQSMRLISSRKEQREHRIVNTADVWTKDVIPHFDQMRLQKKVQQMWSMGIPPGVRGIVWAKVIGNDLKVSREMFESLNKTALSARATASRGDMGGYVGKEQSIQRLTHDIPNTFPELKVFHEGGPLAESLRDVVETFMFYMPEVGYVQGMSFLAAMMLLYTDVFEAFVCLVNLLHKHSFGDFLRFDQSQMTWRFELFDEMLRQKLPVVHQHLKSLAVTPDIYLTEWFLTLFSKHLSLELATRVWDNFLLEGEVFLYRTALGLLNLLSRKLQGEDANGCVQLLSGTYYDVDETVLFASISSMRISKSHTVKLQQRLTEVPSDSAALRDTALAVDSDMD